MASIFQPSDHIGSLYNIKDICNDLKIIANINMILLLCTFANESTDEYGLLYSDVFGCDGDTGMLYIRREVKHEHKVGRGGELSMFIWRFGSVNIVTLENVMF